MAVGQWASTMMVVGTSFNKEARRSKIGPRARFRTALNKVDALYASEHRRSHGTHQGRTYAGVTIDVRAWPEQVHAPCRNESNVPTFVKTQINVPLRSSLHPHHRPQVEGCSDCRSRTRDMPKLMSPETVTIVSALLPGRVLVLRTCQRQHVCPAKHAVLPV